MKKWLDSNHFSLIASITIAGLLIVSIYFIILNIDFLFKLLSDLGSVLTPFMYGLIFAFLKGPIVTFSNRKH